MNPANTEFFEKPAAITFACQGGLDLLSPAVATPPGTLQDCWNYEVAVDTGYTLASGLLLYGGKSFTVYREWIECPIQSEAGLSDFQIGGIYGIRNLDSSKVARVKLLSKSPNSVILQVIDGNWK